MTETRVRHISDAKVFCIGYGCMGLSAVYKTDKEMTEEERLKVLDAVYESGANYWDTADVYGDNEELLNKWFVRSGKRSEIYLASKCGFRISGSTWYVNGSPEYIRQAVPKSLERLGLEQIDLYYLHRPDPKVPIELSVGALKEFVQQGKIRHIGLSEPSAQTLRRAHAVHPISAVQVEYSPLTLDIESPEVGVLKTARELGIAIIAYSPLGRGVLTGRYKSPDEFAEDDYRRLIPRYSKQNFQYIQALVDVMDAIGKRHNATAAQICLAWILAQGDDFIPIPGTSKLETHYANMKAADIQLTPDEVSEIRHWAKTLEERAPGLRYPDEMMQYVFADTPPLDTYKKESGAA